MSRGATGVCRIVVGRCFADRVGCCLSSPATTRFVRPAAGPHTHHRGRCAANNRRSALEELDNPSTSYEEGGNDALSAVGMGLLSSRLADTTRSPRSSSPSGYRRTGGREGWQSRTAEATERIRRLAREVTDVSASAQAAVKFANDAQVGELRAKLSSIEDELRKINLSAEADGWRRSSTVSLLTTLPVPLREAVEEATAPTPTPTWTPPPAPEPEFVPTPTVFKPPTKTVDKGVRPEGTGREVLLQGFNWESHKHDWWNTMHSQADWLADFGFSVIWLPPPTDSVAPEGYLPRDLYNLNSSYGSHDNLRRYVGCCVPVYCRYMVDQWTNFT